MTERIPTRILPDHAQLAREVAHRIAAVIRARNAEGRVAVLGLATGSTPIGVYRELVRLHREEGLSFARVATFNLDEYLPMEPESPHSYHRFMWTHLFSHIDIDPANVHLLDGRLTGAAIDAHCAAFESAIEAAGGIDFQLLGIGKTGHIGFNEPGSGLDSRTRRIHLDRITRRDAASSFFSERHVPHEALTMGVATILAAREIAILATGEHKATIVRRAVEGEVDLGVPATFLQRHPKATFYCDAAAAAELTRVATPWLVDSVQWTPELETRAVIWLSQTVGKAILKLSETDYEEHRLSGLLARHGGSTGTVNGDVFLDLVGRIRGRTKLPKGARVLCFSPHPDDDVISMGGILRKLVENGNAITVAYMTSGNIAVFDHDVRRQLDVLRRIASERHLATAEVDHYVTRLLDAMQHKAAGVPDHTEVADLKRIIRESEAISGLEAMGLDAAHARFLDLPFYHTGTIEKRPVGPEDVAIVERLIRELQPHYIFVAGDLSDPHGTHRMCKDAIDAALARCYPARPRRPQHPAPEVAERDGSPVAPEVWLYRGAWQEWPIHEATWLVPLSGDELRLKIQAIFKHQSQKDSAPFPGQDEREFWQRVEQRNTGTADLLNGLGLAEYNAIEAYVVD
ncbi:MAG: glucosamine-6-phosphate deaminase [Gemmatimonadetes bacterium]|nr:glucosamine-6-phosphate deaminase [Gemmatimonadota bacterium]